MTRPQWSALLALTLALTPLTTRAADAPRTGLKPLILDEMSLIEKQLAARMMRRPELSGDKRARLELDIDLRIVQRAVTAIAANAKFESDEQAIAWLRAKALRDAIRSVDETLGADAGVGESPLQRDAIDKIHKLSFNDIKSTGPALDDLCRALATNMANLVSATPVTAATLPPMRPKPLAHANTAADRPPTVAELTDQVQRVAAISIPLRQQLLALAATANAATDPGESAALYAMLAQSVGLAKGLQSNTAVGPDARSTIESQLTEGIVLYADPRTREAGRNRVEALGAYRQTLTRIGKMGLSKDQMDQLAPAFAWAQANPEPGAKVLAAIEGFIDVASKYDNLPQGGTIPAPLKRPLDDARAQFAKTRATFMADAPRSGTFTSATLDDTLAELRRLYELTDDLQSMQASFDTINAYKIRPVGGLEKKVTTAAIAAAGPTATPLRNDGQRYLRAVHTLARLSQALTARPLTDLPPATLAAWAGGKLDAFESRWRMIVVDLANTLVAGSIELDRPKVTRLESAQTMLESLRAAAQLDAALPKAAPALARWVDWQIDPAALDMTLAPYKEATAAAFAAYATDTPEPLDKWAKLRGRYAPLLALILRDSAYAEQCQSMPIGPAADLARLAAPFEGAPFHTERYATYAITAWATLERTGELETADRLATALAKRLAHDLRVTGDIDETALRPNRKSSR